MFLGGDPSYEQKDTQLIQALGLNLKHVTVGAETAEVARFSQLIAQKKPVIFYWWTPEYRNAALDLVEVKLPPRFKSCQDDGSVKAPLADFRCAYSSYPLEKVFGTKFATTNAGLLYTAKGTASLLVPYASSIQKATGSWDLVFIIAAGANILAAVLAIAILKPWRRKVVAANDVVATRAGAAAPLPRGAD